MIPLPHCNIPCRLDPSRGLLQERPMGRGSLEPRNPQSSSPVATGTALCLTSRKRRQPPATPALAGMIAMVLGGSWISGASTAGRGGMAVHPSRAHRREGRGSPSWPHGATVPSPLRGSGTSMAMAMAPTAWPSQSPIESAVPTTFPSFSSGYAYSWNKTSAPIEGWSRIASSSSGELLYAVVNTGVGNKHTICLVVSLSLFRVDKLKRIYNYLGSISYCFKYKRVY